MKKILCFSLTIILLLTFTGCNNIAENKDIVESKKDERVINANNTFAFDIFKKLNSEDLNQNVFISPFSISAALTMTYNGAKGSTKEGMESTLKLMNLTKEEVNGGFEYLNEYLEMIDKKIDLEIANSIWIREGEEINQDFIDLNIDAFDAYIKSIDFSNNDSAGEINKWIEKSTHGLIDKMIEPPIPPDVIMYLINAIYFKGEWTNQFEEERTFDTNFNNGNGEQKPIKMMSMNDTVDYTQGEDYKAVRLYYGNKKTAMYCILPEEGSDINTFINTLDNDKWNKIKAGLNEMDDLILQIPRFKMEYGIKNLNDALKSLGMEEAFSQEADFSGIREGLFISRVLHKAVIEVNEEGSEAAGVTVVEMKETAVEEPLSFIADRPFIFIIADEEMGSILFMGKAFDL